MTFEIHLFFISVFAKWYWLCLVLNSVFAILDCCVLFAYFNLIFPLKMAFSPFSVKSYFFSAECKSFIISLFLLLPILFYLFICIGILNIVFIQTKWPPQRVVQSFLGMHHLLTPNVFLSIGLSHLDVPWTPKNQEGWKWINSLPLEISSFIMPLPLCLSLHLFIEIFMSSSEVPSPILSTKST